VGHAEINLVEPDPATVYKTVGTAFLLPSAVYTFQFVAST